MTETKKRKRRPAGFERPAGRRFLCVLGDGDECVWVVVVGWGDGEKERRKIGMKGVEW